MDITDLAWRRAPATVTEAARRLEASGFTVTLSPDHRTLSARLYLVPSGCRVDRYGWVTLGGVATGALARSLVVTCDAEGWRVCSSAEGRGRVEPVRTETAALAWASSMLRVFCASRDMGGGGWDLTVAP